MCSITGHTLVHNKTALVPRAQQKLEQCTPHHVLLHVDRKI